MISLKNIITYTGTAVAAILLAASCFGSLEDINKPLGQVSQEELKRDEFISKSFLAELMAWSFPEQENRYQHTVDLIGNQYARYTANLVDGFMVKQNTTFNRFDQFIGWPYENVWAKVSSQMNELKRALTPDRPAYAWAQIMRAHILLILTDTYGPFPIGDENNPSAYVSQKDVYYHIIKELQDATAILDGSLASKPNFTIFPEMDMVYSGDMSKWRRFANSLKLRIALRISAVEPEKAKALAEEALKAGVIEKNEDNCDILFIPAGLYKVSGDWKNSAMSADMQCYLNGYNDPRKEKFFSKTKSGAYAGCLSGVNIANTSTAQEVYSLINFPKDKKSTWFNAAETAFLKAEAVALGWSFAGLDESAETYYADGIKLSFAEWGVAESEADSYLNNGYYAPSSYVLPAGGYGSGMGSPSDVHIAWDESRKFEQIATQKWIAMFPNGPEGWANIRRTGFPTLLKLPEQVTEQSIANRVPYPTTERTNNPEGYAQMLQLLPGGNDDYFARMWWQK